MTELDILRERLQIMEGLLTPDMRSKIEEEQSRIRIREKQIEEERKISDIVRNIPKVIRRISEAVGDPPIGLDEVSNVLTYAFQKINDSTDEIFELKSELKEQRAINFLQEERLMRLEKIMPHINPTIQFPCDYGVGRISSGRNLDSNCIYPKYIIETNYNSFERYINSTPINIKFRVIDYAMRTFQFELYKKDDFDKNLRSIKPLYKDIIICSYANPLIKRRAELPESVNFWSKSVREKFMRENYITQWDKINDFLRDKKCFVTGNGVLIDSTVEKIDKEYHMIGEYIFPSFPQGEYILVVSTTYGNKQTLRISDESESFFIDEIYKFSTYNTSVNIKVFDANDVPIQPIPSAPTILPPPYVPGSDIGGLYPPTVD